MIHLTIFIIGFFVGLAAAKYLPEKKPVDKDTAKKIMNICKVLNIPADATIKVR